MADRDVTVKLNLKPGDVTAIKQVFSQVATGLKAAGVGGVIAQVGGVVGGALGNQVGDVGKAVAAGGAGFAAGGPVGAAIAIIPEVLKKVKDIASLPFTTIGKGFSALSSSIQEIGGELGAGGLILSGMSSLAKQIPIVGDAVGGMIDAFKGFLETGLSLVKLYSPGAQQRFDYVKQDTLATIGRAFLPVMEALTQFTRLLGDFLKTVLPGVSDMREVLSPLKDVFSELREVLAEIAPLIKDVLLVALKMVQYQLQQMSGALKFGKDALPALTLGLVGGTTGNKLEDSTGMAARAARFSSSSKEVAQATYQAAFLAGAGQDPQQQSALSLKNIEKFCQQIIAIGQSIANVKAGTGTLGDVVRRAMDFAGGH